MRETFESDIVIEDVSYDTFYALLEFLGVSQRCEIPICSGTKVGRTQAFIQKLNEDDLIPMPHAIAD